MISTPPRSCRWRPTRRPSSSNQTVAYRFAAGSGDEFVFDSLGSSGVSGNWEILGPDGASVSSSYLSGDRGGIAINRSGRHYLLLKGSNGDATGDPYSFRLDRASLGSGNPGGTAATLGQTLSGTIATAAQQDRYGFTLAGNTRVLFDSLTNSYGLQWQLLDGRHRGARVHRPQQRQLRLQARRRHLHADRPRHGRLQRDRRLRRPPGRSDRRAATHTR